MSDIWALLCALGNMIRQRGLIVLLPATVGLIIGVLLAFQWDSRRIDVAESEAKAAHQEAEVAQAEERTRVRQLTDLQHRFDDLHTSFDSLKANYDELKSSVTKHEDEGVDLNTIEGVVAALNSYGLPAYYPWAILTKHYTILGALSQDLQSCTVTVTDITKPLHAPGSSKSTVIPVGRNAEVSIARYRIELYFSGPGCYIGAGEKSCNSKQCLVDAELKGENKIQ